MKRIIIIMLIYFTSCNKTENENFIYATKLIYYYDRDVVLMNKNGVNKASFTFYLEKYNKNNFIIPLSSKSLVISFPVNCNYFSIADKKNIVCTYNIEISKNNFKKEIIKVGFVEGKQIDNDLWDIKIKVKEINFEGLISTKKLRFANRIYILNPMAQICQ